MTYLSISIYVYTCKHAHTLTHAYTHTYTPIFTSIHAHTVLHVYACMFIQNILNHNNICYN